MLANGRGQPPDKIIATTCCTEKSVLAREEYVGGLFYFKSTRGHLNLTFFRHFLIIHQYGQIYKRRGGRFVD
jgi:hypothetical protein